MRAIKFRAWYQGKMIPAGSPKWLVEFDGDIWENVGKGYQPDVLNDRSDAVLMQFTGLTDRNGKEIYEGDILDSPNGIEVVTFQYGMFGAGTVNGSHWGGMLLTDSDAGNEVLEAVIGNIYQDSELLEAK